MVKATEDSGNGHAGRSNSSGKNHPKTTGKTRTKVGNERLLPKPHKTLLTPLERQRDAKAKVLYEGELGANVVSKLTDKRLKTKLKQSEKKFKDAALEAARSEMLLPQEAGYLEPEDPIEQTWRLTQRDLKKHVDMQTASQIFSLDLPTLGPYTLDWARNGRHLLLGGRQGHVALIDALRMEGTRELHLREPVRDVSFLHNEGLFAVAQKKYVYIYDNQGLELHCLRGHIDPMRLVFLPYHFLLASVGRAGWLKYQDVSTGQLVAEYGTKKGICQAMRQNPQNGVLHLGHANGVVSLWSPAMGQPLVSMLCHRGPVTGMAVDREGRYMASAGMDGEVKLWDLRVYKQLHHYQFTSPPSSVDISQKGLLAVGFGSHVTVWKDALARKVQSPYLRHDTPGNALDTVRFRPYEDVLGLGHKGGYVSMVVPGAGEPNFDTLEANPFQSRKQRREAEVHGLLDKLAPETIALNPSTVGAVDRQPEELMREQRELMEQADRRPAKPKKEKNRMRGKSKLGKKLKRKQKNVVDEKTVLLKQKIDQAREEAKQKKETDSRNRQAEDAPRALQRFF
jgi:U3 small nucleolar RNA-associated protein 7|eukprot:evm.model.NODE_14286_length_23795_cov_21.451103.6